VLGRGVLGERQQRRGGLGVVHAAGEATTVEEASSEGEGATREAWGSGSGGVEEAFSRPGEPVLQGRRTGHGRVENRCASAGEPAPRGGRARAPGQENRCSRRWEPVLHAWRDASPAHGPTSPRLEKRLSRAGEP